MGLLSVRRRLSSRMVTRWMAAGVLSGVPVVAACQGDARSPSSAGPTSPAAPLATLEQRVVAPCLEISLLSPACPSMAPETESPYHSRLLDFGAVPYRVIEFSSGAPYPRIGPRNAPPSSAHIVVKAGNLERAFPFRWPSNQAPQKMPPDPSSRPDEPVVLGHSPWGGTDGMLVLAPPFPSGGVDGDHLIYRWGRMGAEYSVSLHAWTPLAETMSTLHAIVETSKAAAAAG